MGAKMIGSARMRAWSALCVCSLLLVCSASGCARYVLDVDVAQRRLDTATPALDGSCNAIQSFVCGRPNLCQIELLPAVYDGPVNGMLTLQLDTTVPDAHAVAQWSVDAGQIRHNTPVLFSFAPQHDSAGRHYRLSVEGVPGMRVGLWYDSVDAYGAGGLELAGLPSPGDLYFVTRCQYDLPAMTQGIVQGFGQGAWLLAPLVVLLLLPGFLLRQGAGVACNRDPVAALALSVGISLALVPLVLLWSTVVGLHWGRSQCWMVAACLVVWAVFVLARARLRVLTPWFDAANRLVVLGALGLLALTLTLRFVQVRDLALPAWVDSPQHALVTQLVVMQGQVPRSYEPLLPVQGFVYHFGLHADVAWLHWLSGLSIPSAMLILGQVLNTAAALGAYLLALRLTQRRTAALVALVIVGLVSYMPAYYVSWGRYTQLAGMVILPAALVVSLDWLQDMRRKPGLLLVAASLQAGLFMTHARVSVYAACFVAGVWLWESLGHLVARRGERAVELSLRAAALLLLALSLSAPWLVQVVKGIHASAQEAGVTALAVDPGYNAFPRELLLVPRNAGLILLAAAGALLGLLRHRNVAVWTLLWVIIVALLLNPGWAGIEATGLVNNATAVIALYLPLSVLGGEACALAWERVMALAASLDASRRGVSQVLRATVVGVTIAVALRGAWGMISIVNPATVLVTEEDVEAMEWIREHAPTDAVFLINVRPWQLGIYVGSDGGYWIPCMTGRRAILPALSYAHGGPEYVGAVGEHARLVHEVRDAEEPRLRALLAEEAVTHVYIGAKGGTLTPQMFVRSSLYRPVYCSGQVWIFEVLHK